MHITLSTHCIVKSVKQPLVTNKINNKNNSQKAKLLSWKVFQT